MTKTLGYLLLQGTNQLQDVSCVRTVYGVGVADGRDGLQSGLEGKLGVGEGWTVRRFLCRNLQKNKKCKRIKVVSINATSYHSFDKFPALSLFKLSILPESGHHDQLWVRNSGKTMRGCGHRCPVLVLSSTPTIGLARAAPRARTGAENARQSRAGSSTLNVRRKERNMER